MGNALDKLHIVKLTTAKYIMVQHRLTQAKQSP